MQDDVERAPVCEDESVKNKDRRKFLGNLGKSAILAAAAGTLGSQSSASGQVRVADRAPDEEVGLRPLDDPNGRNGQATYYQKRAAAAFQFRVDCASANYLPVGPLFNRPNNGDEALYPSRIGNYSKGLPHQANGEVVPSAYNAMLNALGTATPALFEQIPMGGNTKQTSPQAGMGFDLEGGDPFAFIQPPPPVLASRELGAEIAENYWMAAMRDVAFTDYTSNPIAVAAAADLNLFGTDFKGAKNGAGQVTPNLLFRGLTPGDKAGPYMSQFWYQPCFFGPNQIDRRMQSSKPISAGGQNYMTDFNSWLAIQNGVAPPAATLDTVLRYLRSGRDIGEWVHVDMLFQAYYQAFMVLFVQGFPVDNGNPYNNSNNQAGFATFGPPHIATLLCEVGSRALKVVWNQKWQVHRRLRPEAFGELVDRTAYHGAAYPVHSEILNSVTTNSRLGGYLPAGNAFLPMAFPEGCPTHPAYGAGHGTVAGACVTILKAWFNEDSVFTNPLIPDPTGLSLVPYTGPDTLTVGGELNKVASNVAIGRNIAGVHWRSDATESLILGEALAISILRDQKSSYNETFNGFSLTKFDGTTITV